MFNLIYGTTQKETCIYRRQRKAVCFRLLQSMQQQKLGGGSNVRKAEASGRTGITRASGQPLFIASRRVHRQTECEI